MCDDGGYGKYRSVHDACRTCMYLVELDRLSNDFFLGSFIVVWLPYYLHFLQGVDVRVTWMNVATETTGLLRCSATLWYMNICTSFICLLDGLTFFLGPAYDLSGAPVLGSVWWVGGLVAVAAVVTACLSFCVEKFKSSDFAVETVDEVAKRERFQEKRKAEREAEACTFWFVNAEYIRSWQPSDETTFPRFQELLARGWLVARTMSLSDACGGAYRFKFLAVSHRWLSPRTPDESGEQMSKIKSHLCEHDVGKPVI